MRDRLAFLAALSAAALLGALLFTPRFRAAFDAGDAGDAGALGALGDLGDLQSAAPPPPPPLASASAPPPPPPPPPAYVRENPEGATACPAGMVLVDGIYCPYVGHRCVEYLDEPKDVCQRFAPEVLCEGRLERRRYCVDRYEYPNMEGVRPAVMADWNDARRGCAVEGKRLCTLEEWEFACEGPQMWPYPYGMERDPTACNIGRKVSDPELNAFSDPWKISGEVERLDKRVASGEMPRCVSPFGVHDMTGNVDEWVLNEQGSFDEKPYRSTLKGGYWGPVRSRCRPITSTHNEWFSFYQVGFRCCADPLDGSRVKQAAPRTASIPKRQRMADPRATP